MSAKWRALQHRHRYTYSAVVFPSSYFDSLTRHSHPQFSASKLFAELQHLTSLNSIYAQVQHAKKLASAFADFLASAAAEASVSHAARLYLEIMFLENSLPLHRTLVSVLAKTRNFQPVICGCFRALCNEYGGAAGGKRFCVSRVALSVMGMPKLGYLVDVVDDCAVLVARDVVSGLRAVVVETNESARPSPIVMEQCQEALSCVYYLLQRFPGKFSGLGGEDSNLLEMVVTVIMGILKSTAFSRDCYVAAGVSFCAALQVCLSPEELGLFIFEGIFNQTTCSSSSSSSSGSVIEFKGVVLKLPYSGDIYFEIHSLSVLSRICLIRGILTAVSREVLNTQFVVSGDNLNGDETCGNGGRSVKTVLYDGILLELCNYCENPVDSHFNFHALTVLQICLQQIKTSMLAKLTDVSENYDPVTEEMGARILRIIWNNLEDPLNQTVKQVHLIFDLFLDIQSTLHWGEGSERIRSFLKKIALDLLRLGPRCKGRYVPLASLTRRLGAKTILDMSPGLMCEIVQAYADDDVCCAATSFLKCFLENLRDECWSSDGVEGGFAIYRSHCLIPFLHGLASGISKLRSNLNIYAIPVLLEVDVDSIFPMLAFISVGVGGEEDRLLYPELGSSKIELRVEQRVAVLVSLLKVSRSLALLEGDFELFDPSTTSHKEGEVGSEHVNLYAFVCIKGIKVKLLVEWLVMALTHVDESLRVDAAESLFINPKTASLPSHLELNLLKEAVPLNMRCCSTAFQMKWSSVFRKFFARVRTALERQFKQGSWQPFTNSGNSKVILCTGTEDTVVSRAEDLFKFMRWLSSFLFFSCYPSAPYRRKIMAMELILIMINVWSIVPSSQEKDGSSSPESCLYPYCKGITSPDSTLLLVGAIVDSWDRLRENSFRILLHFPTPLPGISSEDMVLKVMTWAKVLVCSPRVRETDAGTLTLRLLLRKYVLELGWMVKPSLNFVSSHTQLQLENGDVQILQRKLPVIEYIKSLIEWSSVAVEEGEKDLSEACKNSFVHGVLLALRYTFEELDWNSDVVMSCIPEMRDALEKLLELVMRITSLALGVVSADAWHLPEDMDEMVDDDTFLLDVQGEVEVPAPSEEHGDSDEKPVQDVRPEQIVMVGCWLAMKEVSLLLGTIIRKIPLPSNTGSDSSEPECLIVDNVDDSMMTSSCAVLDFKQLEQIGNHFLEVLLKMKHNGAIDKTRAGFTALCNRLLCSNDPRLCKLTESWMEQLMERTVAKGQIVDDLLRRSAGIPAAFTALFLSEPDGAPKKLLPRALRWLIDIANGSLLNPVENGSTDGDSCMISLSKENGEIAPSVSTEMNVNEKNSKIRDEGVIPTVHAFNVLRAAFNDANLASDTSGFSAEALIASVRSFSSPYWEVRNSACQAYTALLRRMIGFVNVQKRESVRRALSGLEFFHRYPALHPFLLNELKVATELLGDGSSRHSESNMASAVHPSLCPMLILLSRLKPSTIASEAGDDLDPFLFMPFIRRCATQSNLRVRVLASRALTGLVSNEKLSSALLKITSELPSVTGAHHASFNSIHGMLLQLSSLLDTNCRALADFSKKDQILGDLIQVLVKCSWIASPIRCPCPILNMSFLKVLDHMLGIARTCHMSNNFYSIRNLLLELSTECLDIEAFNGLTFYDPTVAELREQAAISYFSCVFQASKEVAEEGLQMTTQVCPPCNANNLSETPEMESSFTGLQERLIRSLSDSSYEVRLATLKWLHMFLKSSEFGYKGKDLSSNEIKIVKHWTETYLQATLTKLLPLEKNHRCAYYIVRILFKWNVLRFQKPSDSCSEAIYVGTMDCDSVFEFWDMLISLYKLARHVKTREMLICCLGICIKRFSGMFTSSILSVAGDGKINERLARLHECIDFFVNLIQQHSSPSEPINMRKAAAESMVASGLLEQAELIGSSVVNKQIPSDPKEALNVYARQVLDIWFTCIKLLEDEDDNIRQKLAMDVQKCFTSARSGNSSRAGAVPSQVEKVIESSFMHLSNIFGHWVEYLGYLSEWVLNVANHAIPKGDLVRQVFDKEIDNHHEEKLLVSQICCSQLEKLPVSKSWAHDLTERDEIRSYLCNWRMRFYSQLLSFAEDHIEKQVKVDWIGGVGNHKDAFLPLYANLLGFYALSVCIFNGQAEDGTALLSDVAELGKLIYPFLRNPMICNLYWSVVELHEKMVGASIDHLFPESRRDHSLWDSFDPYFLVR